MRSTRGRRLVGLGAAIALAVGMMPGMVAAASPNAAPYPLIVITPSATTVVAGNSLTFTAAKFTSATASSDITTSVGTVWSNSDVYAGTPSPVCVATSPQTVPVSETCTFVTAGTVTVYAVNAGTVGSLAITVTPAAAASLTVEMSAFYATPSTGAPFAETIGVADTATVTAYDQYKNVATGFTGTVRVSSNDPLFTAPADSKLTKGVGTFSVTFGTATAGSDTWWVNANDLTSGTTVTMGATTVTVSLGVGSYYVPLDNPCRLVDSRKALGLAGALPANTAETFVVSGKCGIPVGAAAVTGNLTVTNSTFGWAVYVGPDPLASPHSSSINFTAGQTRANSITVGLSDLGKLSATYISTTGNTTDLVFDVTGYYGAPEIIEPASNQIFMGVGGFVAAQTPVRVLDTRNNTGTSVGKVSAGIPLTFDVTPNPDASYCGTDSSVVGVTGNLTVTNPTGGWAVSLTQSTSALPATSTINFSAGQTVANSVTMGVSYSGNLHATYLATPGNTTDLVFDVTGYFCSDKGAAYVPIAPSRVLDTRVTGNPAYSNEPYPFKVAGLGGVPSFANAVTGNVTVVNETSGWALFLGPNPLAIAPTSNINFVKGDIVANGVTSLLNYSGPHIGEYGDLNVTYISTNGNTTDVVFDVTGYFLEP